MKRVRLQKLLAITLAILTLFSFASCDKNASAETTAPMADPIDPQAPFVPTQGYKIVYGALYQASTDMTAAADYLAQAMQTVYGVACPVDDDSYSKLEGYHPAEFEILIGDTNRPQSAEAIASLGVNDYTYFVESRNVIVICGGSAEATVQAVKSFCLDVLGYQKGAPVTAQPTITPGTTYTYNDQYDYTEALFNGVPMDEVTVAVKGTARSVNTGLAIAKTLSEYTGRAVRTVQYAKLTGDEKVVICVDGGSRSGKAVLNFTGYLITAKTQNSGKQTIAIEASSDAYLQAALDDFWSAVEVATEQKRIALSYTDAERYDCAEENEWVLQEKTVEEIADGVVYTNYYYRDQQNLPYRVHVLAIDPSKNTICMGSSGDGYDRTLTTEQKQTVLQHMQAAVANGDDVVAGVNADFFAIAGDFHPSGLAIKDGQLISDVNGRPFFGITADGQVMIMEGNMYSSSLGLQHAVGGSNILLKNGAFPTDQIKADTDVHPRTVVGYCEDGTILLMVIDGRQSQLSNGATLYRCGLLMRSLGAVAALNLDGGGSSTMITRQGDVYTTQNSPSDGSLRKIYNSLLVVKK